MMTNMSLIREDVKFGLKKLFKIMGIDVRRGKRRRKLMLKSRVPVSKIKSLMCKRGLALNESGRPTWFYSAYYREDSDPLTNYTLDFICEEVPKESNILVTGCGTGIMLFYLIDQGFKNVEGFDFLDKCVLVANDIAKMGKYNTKIWRDDGFNPSLQKKYDLITAMHWVFSAWAGNYGNDCVSIQEAKSLETRERLLFDFLSKYSPHLNPGGMLIVELIDAVADYRLPSDSLSGIVTTVSDIYPVRHTPDQVSKCAEQCGLKVVSYNMCYSYGHQPRTSYVIKKL
ncbi:MAG: hypothetical protein CVT88_00235 [Candidatus Altiarchaeales archaeon HGW-Altiarchaeales-1]|nr:MAG: hypothetical protein CVT88_00235 [Candidatus Altiarchaeales archaeon HGW-Altiarchaeales-1]